MSEVLDQIIEQNRKNIKNREHRQAKNERNATRKAGLRLLRANRPRSGNPSGNSHQRRVARRALLPRKVVTE